MKHLKDFLAEGISPIVYHFTHVNNAAKILATNSFKLTATVLPSDDLAGKKRSTLFFLSTTRGKQGHYTAGNLEGVVFELDGRKLMNNYAGAPVDYWGREFRKVDQDINELEDRIWHTKQTIPNASKYIKSIHVLIRVEKQKLGGLNRMAGRTENSGKLPPVGTVLSWSSDFAKRAIRKIWMQAKKRRIPIFFYDDRHNWMAQRKSIQIHPDQLKLDDKANNINKSGDQRSWVTAWIELMLKPANKKLSKGWNGADRLAGGLRDGPESLRSFMSDLSSSKSHPDAGKIAKYMRQHKIKSYEALMTHLETKWARK